MIRDPLVDPRPGDRVESGPDDPGEVAQVLDAPIEHGDPKLGSEPGVVARVDTRWGQRQTREMSLETWRRWASGGKVLYGTG